MKMVSMKLSAADKKSEMDGPVVGEAPDYPYGLELRFDGDQLKKLGLDQPAVGDEFEITAKAVVTMYRETATSGNAKPDCEANVQITDLAMGPATEQRRERAQTSHLAAISQPTGRY